MKVHVDDEELLLDNSSSRWRSFVDSPPSRIALDGAREISRNNNSKKACRKAILLRR